jgi:chromosome segregation ATPase
MKLSELAAKVLGLEARAQSADQSLRTDVAALRTTLDTQLGEANTSISALTTKLAEADAKVSELTGNLSEKNKEILGLTEIVTAAQSATDTLRAHMAKVDAAYAPKGAKENATLAELVAAEMNATNTALAKTGVDVAKLPAAPATPGGATDTTPKKFASLDAEIAARKAQAKI